MCAQSFARIGISCVCAFVCDFFTCMIYGVVVCVCVCLFAKCAHIRILQSLTDCTLVCTCACVPVCVCIFVPVGQCDYKAAIDQVLLCTKTVSVLFTLQCHL